MTRWGGIPGHPKNRVNTRIAPGQREKAHLHDFVANGILTTKSWCVGGCPQTPFVDTRNNCHGIMGAGLWGGNKSPRALRKESVIVTLLFYSLVLLVTRSKRSSEPSCGMETIGVFYCTKVVEMSVNYCNCSNYRIVFCNTGKCSECKEESECSIKCVTRAQGKREQGIALNRLLTRTTSTLTGCTQPVFDSLSKVLGSQR